MTSGELMNCIFRDFISREGVRSGDRLPTTRQLVKKYGSSLPTIGKALHVLEREGWIEKTRGRGISLRRVPAEGSDLSKGPKVIGMILPNIGGILEMEVLHGVEQKAKSMGIFLKTATSGGTLEKERSVLESLRSAGASGVVLYPVCRRPAEQEYLASELRDFPIVVVEQANLNMRRSAVTHDNFSAGRDMALYCLSQNRRRVAFMNMGTTMLHRAVSDRFEGYLSALNMRSIPFDPSLLIEIPIEAGILEHGLAIAIEHFLRIHPLPDAVIVPTDNYAWMVIQYLHSKGIRVPGDVLVCGFDNIQDKYWGCRFPTTKPSFYQMGVRATELLLDEVTNATPCLREIVLPAPVVVVSAEQSDQPSEAVRYSEETNALDFSMKQ